LRVEDTLDARCQALVKELKAAELDKAALGAMISVVSPWPGMRQALQGTTALVFCRDAAEARAVQEALGQAGMKAGLAAQASLGGAIDALGPVATTVVAVAVQAALVAASYYLRRFRSGELRILVTTDDAIRDRNVPAVTHVFHVGLPASQEVYLDRCARASAAGGTRASIALVADGEEQRFPGIVFEAAPEQATAEAIEAPAPEPPPGAVSDEVLPPREPAPEVAAAPGTPAQASPVAPGEGAVLAGQYRLVEIVGHGSFANVWRAEEVRGGKATVAIKVFHVYPDEREMEILARLDHPHILRYRATIEHGGCLCLVTDFADGGDAAGLLRAHPGGLHVNEATAVVLAIAEALAYLHAQRIVHRDVKPLNVLFVNGQPRLGDVGQARALEHTAARGTKSATPLYAAPEQYEGHVSAKVDVYALGVTAFELLTGAPPFSGSLAEVMHCHLMRTPVIPANLPEHWRTLLSAMLEKDPVLRPTSEGVLEVLRQREHP
jgi:hypothetical protein